MNLAFAKAGPVTPKDFYAWRQRLGWTVRHTGRQLGVSERTIQRWEDGTRSLPKMLPLALAYLELEIRAQQIQKLQMAA
jgi:DNA-binding transcriptional regulator YiaG